MNGKQLGIYTDRPVILKELTDINELIYRDCSNAVMLIWLSNNSWNVEQFEDFVKRLALNGVLNITVAGWKVDDAFSALITTLSVLPTEKHIMTSKIAESDIKDQIEDSVVIKNTIEMFLVNSWPSIERFDDWEESHIVVVGDSNLSQEIVKLTREICIG